MSIRNALVAISLVFALGTSFAAEAGDSREEAVDKADMDNNGRLDGKEAKTLKKNNPIMYDNLQSFCDRAKDAPKKNGVDLPADPTKKQEQCKKKHIAKPFLKAWIEQKQDAQDDRKQDDDEDRPSPGDGPIRETAQ